MVVTNFNLPYLISFKWTSIFKGFADFQHILRHMFQICFFQCLICNRNAVRRHLYILAKVSSNVLAIFKHRDILVTQINHWKYDVGPI